MKLSFSRRSFSLHSTLLISILVVFNLYLNAQTIDPTTNYIPSPDAVGLGRYGDVTVGHHTGSANIGVPLYTLKGKKLTVPISLSYNSGGLRVNEVASSVGLGWSLNAGGVITRTVRGLPDDEASGFHSTPDATSILTDPQKLFLASQGHIDAEPDEFFYNFMGQSGKFIIDKELVVRTIPQNNLKITTTGSMNEFLIQTPDGSKYTFSAIEEGKTLTSCEVNNDVNTYPDEDTKTAWYLSKYENPMITNETIEFTYREQNVSYIASYSEEVYAPANQFAICFQNDQSGLFGNLITQSNECNRPADNKCVSITDNTVLYLDSIITEVSTIVFNHDTRQDLNNGLRYLNFQVFGEAGDLLQAVQFNQSYFHCPGRSVNNLLEYKDENDSENYRLKLNGVSIIGNPGGSLTHEFLYHENNKLPPRLSFAQDYWGYFNGEMDNDYLIPFIRNSPLLVSKIANRAPSEKYVSTGLLKQIKYPTGGTVDFEYEAHEYEDIEYSSFNEVSKNFDIEKTIESGDQAVHQFDLCLDPGVKENVVIKVDYEIGQDGYEILVFINDPLKEGYDSRQSEIVQSTSPQQGTLELRFAQVLGECVNVIIGIRGPGSKVTIDKATYNAISTSNGDTITNIAGGARIAKITTDDLEGNILERTFEYIKDDGKTSGHTSFFPFFDFQRFEPIICPANVDRLFSCNWPGRKSQAYTPLGEFNGNHVVYRRVIEKYNNGTLGTSIFEYNIRPSTPGDFHNSFATLNGSIPLVDVNLAGKALNNDNWRSGFLEHEYHYRDGMIPLSEKIYHYNFEVESSKGNVTVECLGISPAPNTPEGIPLLPSLPYVKYRQHCNWYILSTLTEKFYDDQGANYVEKVTTYSYDNDNLMQKGSSFINSDGITYSNTSDFKQIGDFDKQPGPYAILPLEQTSKKGTAVISGIKYTYPETGTLQLPDSVFNYEGTFGWDLYGTYGTYSSDGYPASFTKAHYPPVNYTWSDGLLTDQSFAGFTWEFDYDDNSRLQDYLKQVDGQEITYTYDGLQRLKQVIERSGARTTTHSYTLGGPNYLTTSISFADAPTQTVVKEHDGLGRYMRTRSVAYDPQTGNDVITDGGDLDPLGRTVRQVFLPDEYMTLTYEGAPSGRLQKTTYPDAASIKNKYPYSENYFVNLVIDENEHGTETISDIVEKTHHIINPAGDTTTYSYNGFDNVATIKTPKGQFYSYGYDTHQRQNSKTVPGGGTTTYVYNMRDLVATMTDPNTKVTTHAYDDHDRDTLTIIDGKEIRHTYQIDRLISRSAETFQSQVLEETFTYDAYGRVSQRAADNILQTAGDIYDLTYFHTDLTKTSTRAHTGHEGVTVNESFGYDNWMRLKKHQHGLQGGPSATIQGNAYNKRDELIGRSLGGVTGVALQSIDYKYHVRGWLTDINTVESGTDLLPLADCDSVPVGPPIPGLFPPGNSSDPEMLTLGEIINRRFNDEITVGDYNACQEVACDTLECTAQERLDQLTSFTEILQTMDSLYITRKTVPCEGTSFIEIREGRADSYIIPAELVRVRLCDGTEYYIPEHLLSSLSGTYEIVQELAVSSLDQTFEVSIGGNVGTYTLEQLLLLVAEGESMEVDGYMMCTVTDCSTPTIPSCDSAATANQNAFIQMLEDSNYTIEPSTLSYPVSLNRVILCSGVELYLLDSELDSLPGNFAVLDEEEFADDEERKEVNPDDQNLLDAGDLFREKLYYDIASQTLDGDAQRNGNIAHLYWQVMGRTPKGYGFQYDVLDRVTKGTFGEVITGNGGLEQITQSDRYSVYGITYDEDGNLETLNRNGPIDDCGNAFDYGQIDGLTYTISGNRLTSMADAGTRAGYFVGPSGTYNYDGAGNMIYVGPKNLTLSYNALNLPESGSYGAGASTSWDYAADGRKVKYEGIDDTKEYMEGIEYRNNDIFIYHPEGRVLKDSTGEWVYEYSLKDHLGNTRVVFADLDLDGTITDSTEVLHEAHYYPFGMEMEGPWNRQRDTLQPYLYNGKEFHFDSLDVDGDQVKELALGWYDYGARFYDPSVGRFTGVDPISDQFPHLSVFNYASNNPATNIDLHGLQGLHFTRMKEYASGLMNRVFGTNIRTEGKVKTTPLREVSTQEIGRTIANAGDAMEIIGFAVTPLAPQVGLPLAELGEGLSIMGTTIEIAANLQEEGLTTENATDLSVELIFGLIPEAVEQALKKTDLDKATKEVVESRSNLVLKATEEAVKKTIEENREDEN